MWCLDRTKRQRGGSFCKVSATPLTFCAAPTARNVTAQNVRGVLIVVRFLPPLSRFAPSRLHKTREGLHKPAINCKPSHVSCSRDSTKRERGGQFCGILAIPLTFCVVAPARNMRGVIQITDKSAPLSRSGAPHRAGAPGGFPWSAWAGDSWRALRCTRWSLARTLASLLPRARPLSRDRSLSRCRPGVLDKLRSFIEVVTAHRRLSATVHRLTWDGDMGVQQVE